MVDSDNAGNRAIEGQTSWQWRARGAQFLTTPINRGEEIRCYIRDPDGHLIEVGQLVGRVEEASKLTAMTMTLNHIHLRVRDLNAAVIWFEKVLQFHPGFLNERMATFSFNSMTLIFDAAGDDVSATVGFESDNCDRDFKAVVERAAVVLEPPTDKEWGVRTAYFKGPGDLKFEIEGPIANR